MPDFVDRYFIIMIEYEKVLSDCLLGIASLIGMVSLEFKKEV